MYDFTVVRQAYLEFDLFTVDVDDFVLETKKTEEKTVTTWIDLHERLAGTSIHWGHGAKTGNTLGMEYFKNIYMNYCAQLF